MSDQDFQDLQEDNEEKESMIPIRVYLPKQLNDYVDNLAKTTGVSKSELLRHAIFHGLSIYAERSNKYKVNNKLGG